MRLSRQFQALLFLLREKFTHVKTQKPQKVQKAQKAQKRTSDFFPIDVFKCTKMLPFLSLSACMRFVRVKFFR